MGALDRVGLPSLMGLTSGRPDLLVGLVDGPVALDHPHLATGNIRTLPGRAGACRDAGSAACRHGTFVAGVLAAVRDSPAPAIAPGCTLVVRPVFSEAAADGVVPSATPGELATAVLDCVDAGVRIINLSAALAGMAPGGTRELEQALDHTVRRGVLVFAAAGNDGTIGGSVLTRHPWVVPVVGYSDEGRPTARSNLGRSAGLRGLGAPGAGVRSLAPVGDTVVSQGTSVAVPFVSGAAALLWSALPGATAADVKRALLSSATGARRTVVPPLLDAWAAYELLSGTGTRRVMP